MENSKKILIVVGIMLVAAIVLFLVVTSDNIGTNTNGNLNVNAEPTPTTIPTVTPTPTTAIKGEVYTDSENKFSFAYPSGKFTTYQSAVSLPFGKRELVNPVTAYKHEIKTEYCAPSGVCQPTTIDMSFGAAVLPQTLLAIKSENPAFNLTKIKYGEVMAEEYAEGAEGEGMAYYFFQLPNGKTLMLYQRNISEKVLTKYQNVPEFMKIDEQVKTMKDIIASLKFTQ
jgi:hypothetical protein